MVVFLAGLLQLHAGAGEKLIFSPRRESSSLSESSRELSFVSARDVTQAKIIVRARVVPPK